MQPAHEKSFTLLHATSFRIPLPLPILQLVGNGVFKLNPTVFPVESALPLRYSDDVFVEFDILASGTMEYPEVMQVRRGGREGGGKEGRRGGGKEGRREGGKEGRYVLGAPVGGGCEARGAAADTTSCR